jgi:tRNA pseudouridine55 synthase
VGVGPFDIKEALDLESLQRLAELGVAALDTKLLATDSALSNTPQVFLSTGTAYYLLMGQPVLVPRAPTQGLVRIYDEQKRFLGVGEVIDDGRIAPKRLVKP